jgi:putative transposase
MLSLLRLLLGAVLRLFYSRKYLVLENLALRQQLALLKAKRKRPKLRALEKLFWVLAKKLWSDWESGLLVVTPETVVRWHRAGFRLYWHWISRRGKRCGRNRISRELRDLILQMVRENPSWGAPRIHGELLKLGFGLSERTALRWMRKASRNPDSSQRWKVFLQNHREAIAAMDFFTVPTFTFGVLYCFFVISHDRRRILHCNVTQHPTSAWAAQQLREALPYDSNHRHLIFDRDSKFSTEVEAAAKAVRCAPVRTSFRSPWQNGVAERWVGSCRRDLLDHVIVLNERHLKRLLRKYVDYYHDDRTHLGLNKETPSGRLTSPRRAGSAVISAPRLGGLHHRYDLAA